ncbi:MAG TPA: outer membrane beta-barrel protein [Blastocatellia bacterium]|nr:outer membrane beta-barrel protein [Blastocatellia bacterium]
MKKSLCSIALMCLFALALNASADAQTDPPKYEAGGQAYLLRVVPLNDFNGLHSNLIGGFGGRFTYNLTRVIGLEAEVNRFPKREDAFGLGKKTQALFGLKAGIRHNWVGVFAKLRPGITHFSEESFYCPDGASSCGLHSNNLFTLDVGGVVEFYPSRRWLTRIDVGDTMVHVADRQVILTPSTGPVIQFTNAGGTTHNLQVGVGIGFRF